MYKTRTSLCQSATKIGKFTNRQLYQSANLPIGNFPIGKNQSANLPKRIVTNRQTIQLANMPLRNVTFRQHNQLAIWLNGNLVKWQTYNSALSKNSSFIGKKTELFHFFFSFRKNVFE